jgi:hypothetical protein
MSNIKYVRMTDKNKDEKKKKDKDEKKKKDKDKDKKEDKDKIGDIVKEKNDRTQKIKCDCGITYTKQNQSHHFKTKRHTNYYLKNKIDKIDNGDIIIKSDILESFNEIKNMIKILNEKIIFFEKKYILKNI